MRLQVTACVMKRAMTHRWEMCPICGPMVVCGKCGNNACNSGYGTLPDGSLCDECPGAYEMQCREPVPAALAEAYATRSNDPGLIEAAARPPKSQRKSMS